MLDSSAYLHFNLFMHLFSKSVFITHNYEKTNSKKSGQNENKKNNTYDKLICCSSVILDTSFTLLETEFSTDSSLQLVLIINFEL